MFESELFRKQIYCTADSTCDTVGIFGAPIVIWRPSSCVSFVAPLQQLQKIWKEKVCRM